MNKVNLVHQEMDNIRVKLLISPSPFTSNHFPPSIIFHDAITNYATIRKQNQFFMLDLFRILSKTKFISSKNDAYMTENETFLY